VNIILAVDGSESALAAVNLLRSLPLSPDTLITSLAVANAPASPNFYKLEQALDEAGKKLKISNLKIQSEIFYGHPAHEIVRYADKVKPDLIIMGAKGLRATLGILLGGVAQQVVEHANWPVLITRSPFSGLHNILLGLDGSPCSQNALEYLVKFPFPIGAQISLMHVLPPPASEQEIMTATWAAGVDAISIRPTIRDELERAQIEEGERCKILLTQALEKCKEHNLNALTVECRGDAASEILSYAKDNPVDLIVAGSRGLSAISGWLLGSVSRKLVHYAGCSVLIVKGSYCQP